MELQKREKEMLVLYTFVNGMLSKSERIEARKAINEDLNDLLEKSKLSKEEYDEMLKELDEIDEDMKEV
nr:MAG TPA: actin-like protein [Caudoviricetes sp.]